MCYKTNKMALKLGQEYDDIHGVIIAFLVIGQKDSVQ